MTVVLLAVGLELYEKFDKAGTKAIYFEKFKKFSLLGGGGVHAKKYVKKNAA